MTFLKKLRYYLFLIAINFSAWWIMWYFANQLKVSVGTKWLFSFIAWFSMWIMLANLIIIVLWLIAPNHWKEFGWVVKIGRQILIVFWVYVLSLTFFYFYY